MDGGEPEYLGSLITSSDNFGEYISPRLCRLQKPANTTDMNITKEMLQKTPFTRNSATLVYGVDYRTKLFEDVFKNAHIPFLYSELDLGYVFRNSNAEIFHRVANGDMSLYEKYYTIVSRRPAYLARLSADELKALASEKEVVDFMDFYSEEPSKVQYRNSIMLGGYQFVPEEMMPPFEKIESDDLFTKVMNGDDDDEPITGRAHGNERFFLRTDYSDEFIEKALKSKKITAVFPFIYAFPDKTFDKYSDRIFRVSKTGKYSNRLVRYDYGLKMPIEIVFNVYEYDNIDDAMRRMEAIISKATNAEKREMTRMLGEYIFEEVLFKSKYLEYIPGNNEHIRMFFNKWKHIMRIKPNNKSMRRIFGEYCNILEYRFNEAAFCGPEAYDLYCNMLMVLSTDAKELKRYKAAGNNILARYKTNDDIALLKPDLQIYRNAIDEGFARKIGKLYKSLNRRKKMYYGKDDLYVGVMEIFSRSEGVFTPHGITKEFLINNSKAILDSGLRDISPVLYGNDIPVDNDILETFWNIIPWNIKNAAMAQ